MTTRRLFGTDGIRGKANETLTAEIVLRLAQAIGMQLRKQSDHPLVLIGKDPRRSGYMIENALIAGFMSAGMRVGLTGPIPTPGIAMLTLSMRANLGVMITASHNPFEDNGIKLFTSKGLKLTDEEELEIERLMADGITNLPTGAGLGRVTRIDGVQDRYVELVKQTFPKGCTLEGRRIVIDCANGAAYEVAPKVLRELGAEVVTLGVNPNGLNINDKCGSTDPAALIKKVDEVRADVGIALDGDADRVLIVDETGTRVEGDQVLAVIATAWGRERLGGTKVVGTILSNLGFEHYLESINFELVRAPVGDRYVLEHMFEHGAKLGGEESGHIIMSDYVPTGDGLMAALQVMAVAEQKGKKISEVTRLYTAVPQVKRNVRAERDRLKEKPVEGAVQAATKRLADNNCRLVVRPSGTEPVIRLMAEGNDTPLLHEVVDALALSIEDRK